MAKAGDPPRASAKTDRGSAEGDRREALPPGARTFLAWLLVVAGSLALGFAFTARGVATWDSLSHFDRSRWLVHMYGLPSLANGERPRPRR